MCWKQNIVTFLAALVGLATGACKASIATNSAASSAKGDTTAESTEPETDSGTATGGGANSVGGNTTDGGGATTGATTGGESETATTGTASTTTGSATTSGATSTGTADTTDLVPPGLASATPAAALADDVISDAEHVASTPLATAVMPDKTATATFALATALATCESLPDAAFGAAMPTTADPALASSGPASLCAIFVDTAGNHGRVEILSFTRNLAPTLSFTSPAAATSLASGTDAHLVLHARDVDSAAILRLYKKPTSTGACSSDGVRIGVDLVETDGTINTDWNTGTETGNWFVCAELDDGYNAIVTAITPLFTIYPANTCTWTGAVSTDWADAANWVGAGTCTAPPDAAGETALIPASQPRAPTLSVTTTIDGFAAGRGGGTLTIAAGADLRLAGGAVNAIKSGLTLKGATDTCTTCRVLAPSGGAVVVSNDALLVLGKGLSLVLAGYLNELRIGDGITAGHLITLGGTTRTNWPSIEGDLDDAFAGIVVKGVAGKLSSVDIEGLKISKVNWYQPKYLELNDYYQVKKIDGLELSPFHDAVASKAYIDLRNCDHGTFDDLSWTGIHFTSSFSQADGNRYNLDASTCPVGFGPLTIAGDGAVFGYRYENDPNGVVTWVNAEPANARTCVWSTTTASNDWELATNWSGCDNARGGYPGAIDSIRVPVNGNGVYPRVIGPVMRAIYQVAAGAGGGRIDLVDGKLHFNNPVLSSDVELVGANGTAHSLLTVRGELTVDSGATLTIGAKVRVLLQSWADWYVGDGVTPGHVVIDSGAVQPADWARFGSVKDANYAATASITTKGASDSNRSSVSIKGLVFESLLSDVPALRIQGYTDVLRFDDSTFFHNNATETRGVLFETCTGMSWPTTMSNLFQNNDASGAGYSISMANASCSGRPSLQMIAPTGQMLEANEDDPWNLVNW